MTTRIITDSNGRKHWEPALPLPGWPFWKTRLKDALAVWQGKAIAVRQTTKADIKDGTT